MNKEEVIKNVKAMTKFLLDITRQMPHINDEQIKSAQEQSKELIEYLEENLK